MPKTKPTRNTPALMQENTELLRGDPETISIIYRNLTGQNVVSPGYIEMMNEMLEITIDPSKLWINETN
jgi:hypothetical protein